MKPAKQLAIAASEGDLVSMNALLFSDPQLARDWQPIMDACFAGQIEAVRMLLDHGADPNVVSKSAHRYRPLHRTIEPKISVPRTDQHIGVVALLLERGADSTLRGSMSGISAVAMAALAGEQRFLNLLLPRLSTRDLFLDAALGDLPQVQERIGRDPDLAVARDTNGWSALDYAFRSRTGDASALGEIARLLIEAGADLTGALDQGVLRNDVTLTNMLLKRGATIQDGDTLNHAACDGAHEALELVARAGTDLNDSRGTEHHGGYTPFGCTLTMRSQRGAQWFLDHGVDPNHVGGYAAESSLHVAVRSGAGVALLRLLVEWGADPALCDGEGHTPLDAARAKGNQKAVDFLRAL